MGKVLMSEELLEKFNKIEKIHWWWMGRRQLLRQLIGENAPRKLLDVGCGTGETLTFIKTLYPDCQLYGVDPLSSAVTYSLHRGHPNVKVGDAYKLPYPDSTFDVVLFLDVLEHIPDDQAAIIEAKRVLKPGGKIIMSAPALSFIWSLHDTQQGHQRRYTRHQIQNLADNGKLKLTFISYFNFFLSFPIIVIRLLSKITFWKGLADYDSGLNFEIASQKIPNSILSFLFVSEVKLLKYIRYPIGISVAAVMQKTK